MMHGGVAIRKPRRSGGDLLSRLPPELTVAVLEELSGTELTRVPRVCTAWRAMFAPGSPHANCLRAALRQRFGCRVSAQVSGRVYLEIRVESCHLCPCVDVLPFVYAASNALAILAQLDQPVTLFPVCADCARSHLKRAEFDVVVDLSQLRFVLPTLPENDEARNEEFVAKDICRGFLYSDTARFRGESRPIECVRAAALSAHFAKSVFDAQSLHDAQ